MKTNQTIDGEALYNSHEHVLETGPILRRLGTACIVAAALPIATYRVHGSVGEWLVQSFLHRREIGAEYVHGLEGRMTGIVGPAQIKAVIPFSDSEFERLTGCASWREPLT